MSRVLSYIFGAVRYAVGAAQSLVDALLPTNRDVATETETMAAKTETDALSETESESETECSVTMEILDAEEEEEEGDSVLVMDTHAMVDVDETDGGDEDEDEEDEEDDDDFDEANVLRSLLLEAEDRADLWAQQLARAEKRIAALETENEEVTSAFYAASDVADGREKTIRQLEAALERTAARDVALTRALRAAQAAVSSHERTILALEREVERLRAADEDKSRIPRPLGLDARRQLIKAEVRSNAHAKTVRSSRKEQEALLEQQLAATPSESARESGRPGVKKRPQAGGAGKNAGSAVKPKNHKAVAALEDRAPWRR